MFYALPMKALLYYYLIPTDLKLHLQSTDYGNFLANEASPLQVSVIDDKLREKLVIEFQHMRNHAVEPLATFMDYITYGLELYFLFLFELKNFMPENFFGFGVTITVSYY